MNRLRRLAALMLAATLLTSCGLNRDGAGQGNADPGQQAGSLSADGSENTAAYGSAEEMGFAKEESSAPWTPRKEQQLQCILEAKEEWLGDPAVSPKYFYAVTDLDQDGYLELLQACNVGTGLYTYFELFEVVRSSDGSLTLTKAGKTVREGSGNAEDPEISWPDLIVDETAVYDENGALHYIFEDTLRDGAAHYETALWSVTPFTGMLSMEVLGRSVTDYSSAEEYTVSFSRADGGAIEASMYRNLPGLIYQGAREGSAHFSWIDNMEFLAGDNSLILPALETSWEGFSLSFAENGQQAGNTVKADGAAEQSGALPLTLERYDSSFVRFNEAGNRQLVYLMAQGLRLGSEDAKRYPALSAALQQQSDDYSLAQELAEEAAVEALEAYEEDPRGFSPVTEVTSLYPHRADSVAVSFLTVVQSEHPWGSSESAYGVSFDSQTGKRLLLRDVVMELPGLAKAIKNAYESEWPDEVRTENWEEVIDHAAEYYGSALEWTLDPQGMTFYFAPGQISMESLGRISVLVPYEADEDLFTEKYQAVPAAYSIFPEIGESLFYDLDGDGTGDRILLEQDRNRYSKKGSLGVTSYGVKKTDSLVYNSAEPVLLHTEDGQTYLYVEYTQAEDDRRIHVFDLGSDPESGPVLLGGPSLGFATETDAQHIRVRVLPTDPDRLLLDAHLNLLSTFEARQYCSISDGLPVPEEETYEIHAANALILKETMNLETIDPATGDSKGLRRIAAGTSFAFERTDGGSYIDFKTDGGYVVRLAVNGQTRFNGGLDVYEYFDNVVFRD